MQTPSPWRLASILCTRLEIPQEFMTSKWQSWDWNLGLDHPKPHYPPLPLLVENSRLQRNLTGGAWLAQLVDRATLDLRVQSSSPKLSVELTLKTNKMELDSWIKHTGNMGHSTLTKHPLQLLMGEKSVVLGGHEHGLPRVWNSLIWATQSHFRNLTGEVWRDVRTWCNVMELEAWGQLGSSHGLPLTTGEIRDRLGLDGALNPDCWRRPLAAPDHSRHEAVSTGQFHQTCFFQDKAEMQIVMKHLSIFKCL